MFNDFPRSVVGIKYRTNIVIILMYDDRVGRPEATEEGGLCLDAVLGLETALFVWVLILCYK